MPRDFACQTNTCGSSVAASGSCTISVTFTPTAINSRTASISIADNASGSPQSVTLTGTGTASIVSLSAASLTFGNEPIGTSSPSQTITLTDTGNVSLTIASISVTGTNAGDFGETTTCPLSPSSVAANGGSCTITVTFTPSASGNRTASLSIADNATAGSPQAVNLSGTGATGTVGLSPTSLTFGNQSVGTTSAAQIVTLTNGGSSALAINSIQITGTNPGDFAETTTCGSSLGVNASCTVNVTFTPATSGSLTATLTFSDSATNSPQTVSLTGTGTAPEASLSASSLTFSSQGIDTSSSPQSFTLTNTGTSTLTINSIALASTNTTYPNPLDFVLNNACSGSLAPAPASNDSCTITLTFMPTDFNCAASSVYCTTARSALLVITDNNNNVTNSTQTVPITGTAEHDVIVTWTASPTPEVTYNVYRSGTLVNCTSPSATSCVDTNVSTTVSYCYTVSAVSSAGIVSAPSAQACTPTPVPPP